jgi:transcriptional regulator with XRE-family HTH domain
MKPKPNFIGTKIKKARKRAGLSRREFMIRLKSLGLDITETTIFNWESGKTTGPTADCVPILAKALNVSPEFFWS